MNKLRFKNDNDMGCVNILIDECRIEWQEKFNNSEE